jgi:hypothetical protein
MDEIHKTVIVAEILAAMGTGIHIGTMTTGMMTMRNREAEHSIRVIEGDHHKTGIIPVTWSVAEIHTAADQGMI